MGGEGGDDDGPKWTAWSVTRWRARSSGVSGCELRWRSGRPYVDGPECRMGMHVVRENGGYERTPDGPKWTAQSTEEGEGGGWDWDEGQYVL